MKLKVGKKTGLRYFGMKDLRSFGPCYDPARYLPEDFRGTAITILDNDKIPPQDRIWVVLRTSLVSEKLLRLFAVWSARKALGKVKTTDPRSFKACDVAEQFALGQASTAQLLEAREDAWAARHQLWVAYAAAAAIADSAGAAYAAAYAAYAAAAAAADSAIADTAARIAAANTADAADARKQTRLDQISKLREMIIAEGLERIAKKQLRKKAVA